VTWITVTLATEHHAPEGSLSLGAPNRDSPPVGRSVQDADYAGAVYRSMNRAKGTPRAASSTPRLPTADIWLWPSIQTMFGNASCLDSHAVVMSETAAWNRTGSRSATANSRGTCDSTRQGRDACTGSGVP